MAYVLLGVVTLTFILANLSQKAFSQTVKNSTAPALLFDSFWMALNCIIYFVMASFSGGFSASKQTIFVAFFGGIVFAIAAYTAVTSFKEGPMSLTSLIVSFSLVVPIIFDLIKGIMPTLLQVIGLVLILAVFIIINYSKNKDEKKTSVKWFILALLCSITNGLINVCIKYHQILLPGKEQEEYLFFVFLFGSTVSIIAFFILNKLDKTKDYTYKTKTFITPAVLTSVFISSLNFTTALIVNAIPAIILFPTQQCVGLIGLTLISVIVFKEKLEKKNIIGLILGLIAVLLLNI